VGFLDLAKKRCSVRKFLSKPVEGEKLNYILDCGRIAPSAVNFQPWVFIVVREEENRKMISQAYSREWLLTAPVIIILCGDHQTAWKRADGKDHTDIDIAIAADHMTLAAAELGLGTCWICNFDKEKLISILELPENLEPIVMLPLGYPDESVLSDRHLKRKGMEEIVKHEKYKP